MPIRFSNVSACDDVSPAFTRHAVHIETEVIATLRSLNPAQKLAFARNMNRMADWLALGGIQRERTTPPVGGSRVAVCQTYGFVGEV